MNARKTIRMKQSHIILWLLTIAVVMLHQVLQYVWHIRLPLLDNYLDPFLLPLTLLPAILVEHRSALQDDHYTLSIPLLSSITLSLIIISEFIFPYFRKGKFFYDSWDIVVIVIGACLFHFIYNRGK